MAQQQTPSDQQPLFAFLGEWTAATTLDDVPDEARRVARQAILDCLGVTVAGRATSVARVLDAYIERDASTDATLIARQRRASAEIAAFTNGAQGHALDYDDCTGSLGGHPTVAVLPAALAVGEEVGADGAALLEAYVIGFEVAATIGRCVNFTHYERGWHPTATLGVFGATAAAAKLFGLDAPTTATALAIASSTAAGMKANFGTATKPLQAGRAPQNGVFAARLAGLGADANHGAFEHEQGFAELHNGSGNYDASQAFATIANPWDLLDPGLVVKRFPCCASTHSAIESALALREQVRGSADIAEVRIQTHPRRLRHTNRPAVSTGFQGKFSVQYTVARALTSGAVRIGDFTDEAVQDADVQDLLSRVIAEPMPEERWGPDHFAAEVRVRLADGSEHEYRTERPRGNGPEFALTDEELTEKFRDACHAGGFSPGRADKIITEVAALEDATDLSVLLGLLGTDESTAG